MGVVCRNRLWIHPCKLDGCIPVAEDSAILPHHLVRSCQLRHRANQLIHYWIFLSIEKSSQFRFGCDEALDKRNSGHIWWDSRGVCAINRNGNIVPYTDTTSICSFPFDFIRDIKGSETIYPFADYLWLCGSCYRTNHWRKSSHIRLKLFKTKWRRPCIN